MQQPGGIAGLCRLAEATLPSAQQRKARAYVADVVRCAGASLAGYPECLVSDILK